MEVLKKNSYVELLLAVAMIFGIAIFILILYNTYNVHLKDKISGALEGAATPEQGKNTTKILEKTGVSLSRFDIYFPLLLVGIFVFILLGAFLTESPKAFFFIGLIILGVILIVGVSLSNVYEKIAENDEFTTTDTEFGIMAIFLDNLPLVIFILFIAVVIILYGLKARQGGGY